MSGPPPPDLAERITEWFTAFTGRHPALVRRARRVYRAWCWITLPLLLLVLLFVPESRRVVGVYAGLFFLIWQLAVLARSRSLAFASIARFLAAGAFLALPIGLLEVAIGDALGLTMSEPAALVWIAGPVEEPLKLLPLGLFALVARNRARRFGVADHIVAAAACGAGFQLVEDVTRRISATGISEAYQEIVGYDTYYTWHAFLPGWSDDGDIRFAGHAVTAALIGAAIGLAVRWRGTARLLPPLALAWAVLDHMAFNDGDGGGTLPSGLSGLHTALGSGHLTRWLVLAALVAGTASDYRAIRRAGLPPLPGARHASAGESIERRLQDRIPGDVPHPVRWAAATAAACASAVVSAGSSIGRELLILWLSARRGLAAYTGATRFLRGHRELGYAIVGARGRPRRDAPPSEELNRAASMLARLLAPATVLLAVVMLVHTHTGPGHDAAFLANLFDQLAEWWDGQSLLNKILIIGGIAAGLTLFGGLGLLPAISTLDALGLALTATGVAGSGHGIATFIRHPGQAVRDYLRHKTPGQVALSAGLWIFGRGAGRDIYKAYEEAKDLGKAGRRIPHGFADHNAFRDFSMRLHSGINQRYPGTRIAFQGSAVTGRKYTTGAPFDVGRRSDFDIAVGGKRIFDEARRAGVPLRGNGTRTAPLSERQAERLGLGDLQADLGERAGRDVHFMIYRNLDTALSRSPSIEVTTR